MAHNGCIWGFGDNTQSDTNQLAGIIRAVGPNAFMTEEGRVLLKNVIGNNDKLVFLHASGMSVKVNGSFGHESNGNWYSNYSYREYVAPVSSTPIKTEWKNTSTTVIAKPTVGAALGAPGKKTKPRFQEDDVSHLRPELRKLRADIIVRSTLKSNLKKKQRRQVKVTGLAATSTNGDGKLLCDRGIVYDDMWQENKYSDGYSKIDWDAMNDDDWKQEAAKMRAQDDGENTRIPQTG